MKRPINTLVAACALMALTLYLPAQGASDDAAPNADLAAKASKFIESLRRVRPGIPIEAVYDTPIPGMYGVAVPGGSVLYGTADGRHLIAGDLYELGGDLVNLTEAHRAEGRRELLASADVGSMVVFAPEKPKAVISVFTDVDCGFCRKLHLEMAEMNALGIEVRYLAYPRAGIGSDSYDKIVSAWCAKDQQTALTELKLGNTIPAKSCANPVADHFQLGQALGISGTPAILTSDGKLLPGYMPAAQLAAAIGL